MADILAVGASYGQLGVMIWIVYELRDIRRWLKTHLVIYHGHKADDI